MPYISSVSGKAEKNACMCVCTCIPKCKSFGHKGGGGGYPAG